MFRLSDGRDLIRAFPSAGPVNRRQDAGDYLVLNGAVYVYDVT